MVQGLLAVLLAKGAEGMDGHGGGLYSLKLQVHLEFLFPNSLSSAIITLIVEKVWGLTDEYKL